MGRGARRAAAAWCSIARAISIYIDISNSSGRKSMASNLENFKSWYVDVLESLYCNREAGFIIMMIAFPLIERYFRQKLQTNKLNNPRFHQAIVNLFPELSTIEKAKEFWDVHRHGFLHRITFETTAFEKTGQSSPSAISHDKPDAIVVDEIQGTVINPVKFSKRVIRTILADFSIYEGHVPSGPLPVVRQLATETGEKIEGTIHPSLGSGVIMNSDGDIMSLPV
jgi:hypothetical protein